MYAVLAKESLTRHPFKHWVNKEWQSLPVSKHTDRISTSVICSNNYYVSFLRSGFICTHTGVHAYKWRKWLQKWSHSSSLTGLNCLVRLQSCEKVMGWCTVLLLYCAKTNVKDSNNLKKCASGRGNNANICSQSPPRKLN